jgi:protein gp37
MSTIEWTNETWNPFVGCSKISPGCTNCYAINQAYRNNAMAKEMPNPGRMRYYEGLAEKKGDRIDWTGIVRFVPEALEIPFHWKKPRKIFVNSMSDLFHESIPFEQIDQVIAVMALTGHHTYQALTKRPERMLRYFEQFLAEDNFRRFANQMADYYENRPDLFTRDGDRCLKDCDSYLSGGAIYEILYNAFDNAPLSEDDYLANVWLGVTVENQKAADERIPLLLQTPAAIRFLSVEPQLEKIDLTSLHMEGITNLDCLKGCHGVNYPLQGQCKKIDWCVIGGESGPGARPFYLDWARSLLQQCKEANVPAFMKQLGSNVWDSCPPPEHLAELGVLDESYCQLKLRDRKGASPSEWPEELRVREFPVEK